MALFRNDRPYMTRTEQQIFKALRDRGLVSYYRTETCQHPGCDQEVLRGKQFCSREHAPKPEEDEDD